MTANAIGCALALYAIVALPAWASDLALKRVMLSSGGVGYFEYEAAVEGDANLTLDVALDQVDDVLKSLVVYDAAGRIGEVTLPGRNPLAQSFTDLPFERAALGSAIDLLNALQGAEIRVERGEPLTGRLVHVDRETPAGGSTIPPLARTRVTVLTAAGLQQFLLEDIAAIRFVDAELQRTLDTALTRIAAYRNEARRQLSLTLHGTGARTVRVGYVVAAPLWKASYRLSLPADPPAATARLQGWAVLENFSGQAWQDVELSLLSGNPVTFRQALYESYYVPRPTVPVEIGGRVLPPPDTGAVGARAHRQTGALPSPPPAPAPAQAASKAFRQAAPLATAEPAPPPAGIEAADATENATQVSFTLPYRVSAPVGQSLMLPLLDRDLPAHRVALYQPGVNLQHPLAAIDLDNISGTGLPSGVLTLYQQGADGAASYIGDARLAAFPAGEKRLLSYAVDQKTTIDRDIGERRLTTKAAIADGVLRLTQVLRRTTTYRIRAAAPPLSMIVEQPRQPGWTLKQPDPDKAELTPTAYRVPVTVSASETTASVVEEQPADETIALTDLADDRLDAFASSAELDPNLRQALGELAKRRQAVSRQRSELDRLREKREQLVEDESRLRDNLGVVGSEPGLRKRLIDRFTQTETAIDNATNTIAQAQTALSAAEHDLAGFINTLRL